MSTTQNSIDEKLATSALTGTLQAAQFPAMTGDVTNTAGSLATTVKAPLKKKVVMFSALSPSVGQQGSYVTFPAAGTITGWSFAVDAGTATVEVWKIGTGTASPTAANKINTSGVSISTGTAVTSNVTTDFTTTSVAQNDIFAFNILAVSGVSKIMFELEITLS